TLINSIFGVPAATPAPGTAAAATGTNNAFAATSAGQVSASLAAFAGDHGFTPQEVASLGNRLTTALNAQSALGPGDWQGALSLAGSLGPNAGETMQRLTAGALDAVPAQAQQLLGAAGFTFSQVRALGTRLPQAYAAAAALAQGDWK